MLQTLMDAGFRRSGDVFYQMTCPRCRSCVPIRVPVRDFHPTRSQRRALRKNRDLRIDTGIPEVTPEKHALYARYLLSRHDGSMTATWEEFVQFLYDTPVRTIEIRLRDPQDRLVGVGICDLTPSALSTVYFYYDPDLARRSLGVFSSLVEIRLAQTLHLHHYYLGYWVEGCSSMSYKARYHPNEVLGGDGRWRPYLGADGRPVHPVSS